MVDFSRMNEAEICEYFNSSLKDIIRHHEEHGKPDKRSVREKIIDQLEE